MTALLDELARTVDAEAVLREMDTDWLIRAAVYAYESGDWLYVATQFNKHAVPAIRERAQELMEEIA